MVWIMTNCQVRRAKNLCCVDVSCAYFWHSRKYHNKDFSPFLLDHWSWYGYNQSKPTRPTIIPSYLPPQQLYSSTVQVFFSSFHAKSAMCMHCCCLLFWTFARIKCIHHHSRHACKGNILKGSLMYQH